MKIRARTSEGRERAKARRQARTQAKAHPAHGREAMKPA